jgi:hypothetical protein
VRNFFSIAYLVVLTCCTLLALRMWYTKRGTAGDPAEQAMFRRFVLGIALFWLVALAGYFGGFFSLSG